MSLNTYTVLLLAVSLQCARRKKMRSGRSKSVGGAVDRNIKRSKYRWSDSVRGLLLLELRVSIEGL